MRFRRVFAQAQVTVEALDTATTKALLAAMPFESRAQTWGVVEPGTVCFWTDPRPKLANPCNVLGTTRDFLLLKKVRAGDRVRVEKA